MMDFITAQEAAEKWGVSHVGRDWIIPADDEKLTETRNRKRE